MTDRELLENAAKAAGYLMTPGTFQGDYWLKDGRVWNPLADDGDALRLAVKVAIEIDIGATCVIAFKRKNDALYSEDFRDADPLTATRRAIVRAAAAIGSKQ